ncbi:MAG: sigma-54 dependent transcriptional regulator [Pirellulales bacterium]
MATQTLILVVAAGLASRKTLEHLASSGNRDVITAETIEQATAHASKPVALVICHLRNASTRGIGLMRKWRAARSDTHFLFVVDAGDTEAAREAIKAGADGYLREPIDPDELQAWIRKSLESWQQHNEVRTLQAQLNERLGFEALVAQSKVMRQLIEQARAAAQSEGPTLIAGEPGTGKRLLAEVIHHNGPHRAGPFVAFDVPTSPVRLVERDLFGFASSHFSQAHTRIGRIELAAGGTLFIDDVADLAAVTQARLLRELDQRLAAPINGSASAPPSARLIASTVRKLEVLAAEGRFSGNLLRRISVFQLRLPPLRERREDIPLLVDQLLRRTCDALARPVPTLEPELSRFLTRFDWPANVRQLSDCLETMVALSLGDVLTLDDLPSSLDDPTCGATGMYFPAGISLAELERSAVEQALAHCGGNRTRAAQRLGISVRTLQRKLKTWSLEDFEPAATAPPASHRTGR